MEYSEESKQIEIMDSIIKNCKGYDIKYTKHFVSGLSEDLVKLFVIGDVMDCKHLKCIECGKELQGLDHHDGKCFECINAY